MTVFRENHCRENLYPLTLSRHSADIRVGILLIREKWNHQSTGYSGEVPANLIPTRQFFDLLQTRGWDAAIADASTYRTYDYPWELPALNAWAIQADLELIMAGRKSAVPSASNRILGSETLFLEEGVHMECAMLNTTEGPIYIGAGATIMEGAMLRGPLSVGAGAIIKMGATIYGATTIGPGCVIGGEVKNSIFSGYSNKGHDGYIGDAVIGEWCNLGAGTSCSNLRNVASPVKVWHMASKHWHVAGLKCGLIMGDYSTTSINCSFNTGTVVGISANIFQSGQLLPKFIPSFSWGADGSEKYQLEKVLQNIQQWMTFKNQQPDASLISRITKIYNQDI